jgi:ABC-type transport system involved in multi-copper enzyme maturation permease subunit
MNVSLAITDFPDRLSPMVVKELRQGLRTRLFGGVLLTLHLMLVLLTLMSGGAENAAVVSGWFDGIITLVLCIIMPLRGFSAVADELKSGTLDMLALTRLSAGRIIFGKWAAIASQSLLLMLSILPYVVARFVFGGLDLFGEIAALFYKWLAGVVIAAVIVALSTQRQFWLRAVVVFLPLLMIGGCSAFSFMVMTRMGTSTTSGSMFTVFTKSGGASSALLVVGMAAWAIFFFLSLAATRIAPSASLLSVVKRSVHFVMILSLLLLGWLTGSGADMGMIAAGVLTLLMIDALTERVNEVPSVYAAFYQRGWLGRVALWLLAPGWVTGLLYSALLVALVAVYVGWTRSVEEAKLVAVSAAGTWMIAALVQLFSTRKSRDLLPPFIIFWLFVNVVIAILSVPLMASSSMRSATAWFTCAIPQFLASGYKTAQAGDKAALLQLGMLTASIWPALLLIAALFAWRHARGARQEGWRMIHGKNGGTAI